jgi:cytochrome c oxidase subunit 2
VLQAVLRRLGVAVPGDASLDGHLVDGAIGYLTVATGIAFVALVAILVATLVLHRARPGRDRAHYEHGRRWRDRLLTFAVALTMFVAVDATLAARSSRDLREHFWNYPDDKPEAIRVEVTARQWSWTFRTAGPDNRFGTPDDVVTLNELHVPVGRPIYLKLRSKDVVHSFYIPSFRTKVDAIPGSTSRIWFQAQTAGSYEIGCAQHCGVSHYKMRGLLVASADDAYRTWLARAETDSRLRYDPAVDSDGAHPDHPVDAWDWETGR